jgi:hypothetical protein
MLLTPNRVFILERRLTRRIEATEILFLKQVASPALLDWSA